MSLKGSERDRASVGAADLTEPFRVSLKSLFSVFPERTRSTAEERTGKKQLLGVCQAESPVPKCRVPS